MTVQAYAATSVPQGGKLEFHLNDPGGGAGTDATVVITNYGTGQQMTQANMHVESHPTDPDPSHDRGWPVGYTLNVPMNWASGLYQADFTPVYLNSENLSESTVFFAVRSAHPGVAARILVSCPFPTWHAYYKSGVPGESPYWNEMPDRAPRVSVNRPCTEGPNTGWEGNILKWLPTSGYAVEYCSGYDFHTSNTLLSAYQLLVCVGHDEYWTAEMRDNAERFLAAGGNIAFFTGNTCWWQFRLEDGGKTFVCYRDATADPLTGVNDSRVTVEWGSAPVNRPENSLTGVSFRYGAGCWVDFNQSKNVSWTVCFEGHWAFEGTGLTDGAAFGVGSLGYETDAADYDLQDGVPRVTGHDGTPQSFVVLAYADLHNWRNFGQGGNATMGVFRVPQGGVVFNAATTGWGNTLADPIVQRITTNVMTRLSTKWPDDAWELIGDANQVTAMVECENNLFAADSGNRLWMREPCGQDLNWQQVGDAQGILAMASPREAIGGRPIGLYAADANSALWQRDPVANGVNWNAIGNAPGIIALAACYDGLFGATNTSDLLYLPFAQIAANANWVRIGQANNVVAMTNMNGRLFFVTSDLKLWTRAPELQEVNWTAIGTVPEAVTAIAGYAGKLIISTTSNGLYWREL